MPFGTFKAHKTHRSPPVGICRGRELDNWAQTMYDDNCDKNTINDKKPNILIYEKVKNGMYNE